MQELEFCHNSKLDLGQSGHSHYYLLRIIPHDDPAQKIKLDHVDIFPSKHGFTQIDGFGNTLFVGSCLSEHDSFGYDVRGTAAIDSAKGRGSECSVLFRYPSPLTVPGTALLDAHAQLPAFNAATANPASTFERAKLLCSFVHNEMDYIPGTTTVATTAEEAFAQRKGVCQDYAHILAALLRMDGIPARYICGLMIGEGATHAWVEFWDGTTWWGIDPTNDCEAGDFYVVLARGRDHGDCPMERGIFMGGLMQKLTTHVRVQQVQQAQQ